MKLFSKTNTPKSTMVAIVESEGVASSLQAILAQFPAIETKIKTTDDALGDAGKLVNGSGDVVVVECNVADERAQPSLKRLAEYVGVSGHLIVLARNADASAVRHLFRLGATDVLDLPVDGNDLSQAIASALQAPRASGKSALGRVISILKCGGGAGATTLALNLAHNISSRRKVVSGVAPRVLVIDFDLQFGSVASMAGVDNTINLIDLVRKGDNFDPSHIETAVKQIAPTLDVLPSPAEIMPQSVLSGEFLQQLITAAKGLYDYVVLDHAQNWSSGTAYALRMSDAILPVALPTVEHAKAATTILMGLDSIDVDRNVVLFVHNRIRGIAHRERAESIDKLTRRPSLQLPDDPKVHENARNRGKLLHDVSGSKAQIRSYTRVADRIFELLNTPLSSKRMKGGGSRDVATREAR